MKIHPLCFQFYCYRSSCEQFVNACFINIFIFFDQNTFWPHNILISGDLCRTSPIIFIHILTITHFDHINRLISGDLCRTSPIILAALTPPLQACFHSPPLFYAISKSNQQPIQSSPSPALIHYTWMYVTILKKGFAASCIPLHRCSLNNVMFIRLHCFKCHASL